MNLVSKFLAGLFSRWILKHLSLVQKGLQRGDFVERLQQQQQEQQQEQQQLRPTTTQTASAAPAAAALKRVSEMDFGDLLEEAAAAAAPIEDEGCSFDDLWRRQLLRLCHVLCAS